MAEEPTDRSGTDLGPYHLVRELGRGGMGVVYEAHDTRLGRTVALKILRPEVVGDAERRARFEREAKALAALRHPGIVTIHSFETVGADTFFTMELVSGRTLTEVMRSEEAMSVSRILEIGIPVADALSAAHKRGIAHRDVKPDNIIIGPDGGVTVLDFGLAKLAGPAVEPTAGLQAMTASMDATIEGRIIGTIHYMAPEQTQGGETTPTTDVFALGVVLYEMATGANPFPGESTVSKLSSILKDDPAPIRARNRAVPPELERIVRRCLEKDPDRRWQNALDVRNELQLLETDLADPDRVPTDAESSPAVGGRLVIVTLLLVVLGVGAGFLVGVLLMDLGSDLQQEQLAASTAGRPQCVSVTGPEGYELEEAQISPDGRLIAMVTRTLGPDGEPLPESVPGEHRSLHLRAVDSFETRLVPDSDRILCGEFSPDGRSYTFVRLPLEANLSARLMRLELGTGLPPVQVGAIPLSLVGFQTIEEVNRGFAWLDKGTLAFITQAPFKVLTLDSKTGDEIARVDFQSDTEIQPTLIHGALDEDHFIVGVNFYDERGYLQDAYWVNARTGESGLLVDSAPIARVVGGDQLLFTKGQTLYRAGYDPATRSVTGAAEPVFTGLRTANSWSSGNFDVAANGTVVHLPGGLQGGSRSLWTSEGPEDEPRPLEHPSRPFEEWVSVNADGSELLVTHTNDANDMWDLWGGTTDPPRIRRLQSFPDRDIHAPVLSRDGRLAAAQITTTQPSRRSELVVLDPRSPGRELRVLDVREGGRWLTPYDITPGNDRVVYGDRDEGGTTEALYVVGVEEDARPKRIAGGRALQQNARWSPDGALLAWTSNESGRSEALVATYDDTGLGRVVPASDGLAHTLGWSVSPDGTTTLHCFANNLETVREVSVEDGRVVLGPIRPGRSLGADTFYNVVDEDGGLALIRRGANEAPATRLELISGFFAPGTDPTPAD